MCSVLTLQVGKETTPAQQLQVEMGRNHATVLLLLPDHRRRFFVLLAAASSSRHFWLLEMEEYNNSLGEVGGLEVKAKMWTSRSSWIALELAKERRPAR